MRTDLELEDDGLVVDMGAATEETQGLPPAELEAFIDPQHRDVD